MLNALLVLSEIVCFLLNHVYVLKSINVIIVFLPNYLQLKNKIETQVVNNVHSLLVVVCHVVKLVQS